MFKNSSENGITFEILFGFECPEEFKFINTDLISLLLRGKQAKLTKKQKYILFNRYWKGSKLKKIAEEIGIDPSYASTQCKAGLNKIQTFLMKAYPMLRAILPENNGQTNEQPKETACCPNESEEKCPDYLFLKYDINGDIQLEIPTEYLSQFKPISKATYDRWLEEKKNDPIAMKELQDEMELREKENQGSL